jgi:molybdopterin converting factor small subunit
MTIGFLGAISQITGVREKNFVAPTVETLLASLLSLYGDAWKERVFDGKDLIAGVIVTVNGINIQQMDGDSTPLSSEDRIDIFPMFEGG